MSDNLKFIKGVCRGICVLALLLGMAGILSGWMFGFGLLEYLTLCIALLVVQNLMLFGQRERFLHLLQRSGGAPSTEAGNTGAGATE